MAWRMKGEYLKNCSCYASCTCDADGRPSPQDFCEGVVGMRVTEGDFDGVDLAGTTWVVTVNWPAAMFMGNGTAEVYVDQSASEAQRNALLDILSGSHGGTFFEIVKAVCPTVVGPHFVDIEWKFDYAGRTARIAIGDHVETETVPIAWPPNNVENRVLVRMPNGFEYKEAEVAHATVLKSKGAIEYDYSDKRHSSLALVEHTDRGLVA